MNLRFEKSSSTIIIVELIMTSCNRKLLNVTEFTFTPYYQEGRPQAEQLGGNESGVSRYSDTVSLSPKVPAAKYMGRDFLYLETSRE